MAPTHRLTAIIERSGDTYVSSCPELSLSSHGTTIEEARRHLGEAVDRFLSNLSPSDRQEQIQNEVYVTHLDIDLKRSA
ncbi:MAG: type II toxin-antitoxin system HicB family antitoxin [Candidatus Hydrogenedentes bacterium]|nr:type II toxin-antitoxin system HicB family antitoxin [Candidatus Hydrogenedentota bacterium]